MFDWINILVTDLVFFFPFITFLFFLSLFSFYNSASFFFFFCFFFLSSFFFSFLKLLVNYWTKNSCFQHFRIHQHIILYINTIFSSFISLLCASLSVSSVCLSVCLSVSLSLSLSLSHSLFLNCIPLFTPQSPLLLTSENMQDHDNICAPVEACSRVFVNEPDCLQTVLSTIWNLKVFKTLDL